MMLGFLTILPESCCYWGSPIHGNRARSGELKKGDTEGGVAVFRFESPQHKGVWRTPRSISWKEAGMSSTPDLGSLY